MIIYILIFTNILFFCLLQDANKMISLNQNPKFFKEDIVYHTLTQSECKVIRQATLQELSYYYGLSHKPYVGYWLEILNSKTGKLIDMLPIAQSSLKKL